MGFLENFHYYWIEKADQRILDMPLMVSIYQVPFLLFVYLYFVLRCGPRFMKNKQPYSLRTFMQFYNIIQIVLNAWLTYAKVNAILLTNSWLICKLSMDYSYNPIAIRVTRYVWYYFMLKLLDFVETIIFVLRKKNNQISGLHLYHHISTLLFTWLMVRYYPVVPAAILCMINCYIHVIMYTYYFLASLGPNIQKVIAPIKSWITIAQMVQFVFLLLYMSQNLIPNYKCVPHIAALSLMGNILMNFYLFYNFYQNTYVKRNRKNQ